jgi:signal transduction histidine kinase
MKTLPDTKTRVSYWACQAFGWGTYSVLGMRMAAHEVGWTTGVIAGYGLFFFYSIALTDLLRREIKRRHWLDAPGGRMLARLGPAVLGIGTVQTLLVFGVDFGLTGRTSELAWTPRFWLNITGATAIWTIFYVALTAPRRYREKQVGLELALREAELRALEAQVNPHFLFNCLNSIRALVIENPPLAQDMLTRLASTLRFNLHRDLMHTIPLASEVEAVTDYLALEQVRFEDRLRVEFAIDPAAAQAAVPPMLFQTLVENALKHGIAPLAAGGDLVIRATALADGVLVEVENTGQIMPPKAGATQVGLANIRERLRILYGDAVSLDLRSHDGNRVVASVVIPNHRLGGGA